jgi:hypothetical protein
MADVTSEADIQIHQCWLRLSPVLPEDQAAFGRLLRNLILLKKSFLNLMRSDRLLCERGMRDEIIRPIAEDQIRDKTR